MPKNGRPSLLTDEVQRKVCDAVAAGNYYQAAAAYAGVTYTTFRNWMLRGKRARRGKFFEFFAAVKLAEAQAQVTIVAQWKSQIPESYQAGRDFLARRWPKQWAPKERLEHTGKDGGPIAHVSIEDLLELRRKLKERENAGDEKAAGGGGESACRED